jgi:hypothetical protein
MSIERMLQGHIAKQNIEKVESNGHDILGLFFVLILNIIILEPIDSEMLPTRHLGYSGDSVRHNSYF